jgi:glycosyltransferase involved in cell wall biosynthesis
VLRHLIAHAVRRLPLADLSYYQPRAIARAAEIIRRERIELLEIHHLHCAFYRRFLPALPALLINHNIESDLWPFWPLAGGSAVERMTWRVFGAVSRANARAIEIGNLYRFDAKAFVSSRDLARVSPDGCPRFHLPMCVDDPLLPKTFHEDRFVLLWVGGFFWPPNLEAVRWLLDEIWPALRARATVPLELHVVGSGPPDALRRRHDGKEIFIHGHVRDVAAFRAAADACIVPLREGGGVRIKIVEALAAGVPVVSTAKGCEGLAVESGREVSLAETALEFVEALVRLMKSVAERRAFAERGRRYCLEQHSPAAVAAIKERIHAAVLGLPSGAQG